MKLNRLAKQVHKANINWWRDPATGKPIKRCPYGLLALIHSELSEALEGARKGLMDDKLPHRKGFEVEIADAIIRCLDMAGGLKMDLGDIFKINGWKTWSTPVVPGDRIEDSEIPKCINEAHDYVSELSLQFQNQNQVWQSTAMYNVIEHLALMGREFGLDLDGAIKEKLEYNAKRADHKPANRLKKGGKKW